MKQSLNSVTYLVREYDEAIEFFTTKLQFDLIADTVLNDDKRWVLVHPRAGDGASLLLAKAATPCAPPAGSGTWGRRCSAAWTAAPPGKRRPLPRVSPRVSRAGEWVTRGAER